MAPVEFEKHYSIGYEVFTKAGGIHPPVTAKLTRPPEMQQFQIGIDIGKHTAEK